MYQLTLSMHLPMSDSIPPFHSSSKCSLYKVVLKELCSFIMKDMGMRMGRTMAKPNV